MRRLLLWVLAVVSLALVRSEVEEAATSLGQKKALPKLEWWQTTVFYHLYPRSFRDADGDGVGDLKGMIEKLPAHLHDLGIGAVWLSPIFKSPMLDFGYDIADYKTFEPVFGDLTDFEILKEKLHSLGIKILLDFVPNHTSDQHDWFQKSLANIAPYDDFYVWAEPKGWNGSEPIPPNNWETEFTGSAWTFAAQRQKFYLHHFQPQQPDLNYNNPKVVEAMNEVIKFWLGKGVDGFRVDACPFLFEDAQLRDDPVEMINKPGFNTPIAKIVQEFSRDQAQLYNQVSEWRRVLDEYTRETDNITRVMLLEAYADLNHTMQYYSTGDNSMPFNFLFFNFKLNSSSTAQEYSDVINMWMKNMPAGKWPNWVLDNHDNPRTTSRFGPELVDALNALLLLLPGTPVLYNGQEIGMQDTDIPWSEVQDPFALRVGPALFKEVNRDPERCPMQWDDSDNAGFSSNPHTWLPVNPNFYRLNVKAQKAAEVSHYKIVQRLIQLRRSKVFQYGGVKTYVLGEKVLAFTRFLEGEPTYVVVINLDNFLQDVDLSAIKTDVPTLTVHTASVNSKYRVGDLIPTKTKFGMRPKSTLVLSTTSEVSLSEQAFDSVKNNTVTPSQVR